MKRRSDTIEYEGKLVHGGHYLDVPAGMDLRIRFFHAKQDRRQGLYVRVEKGTFEINRERGNIFILWSDAAPDSVEVINHSRAPGGRVYLYNAWLFGNGDTTHALTGNSGMLVDEQNGKTYLRCSDGVGEPSFNDLVVEVSLVPQAEKSE